MRYGPVYLFILGYCICLFFCFPKHCCTVLTITVDLQWLEHWWLVYHDCFELVFGKNPIAADLGYLRVIFFLFVLKMVYSVFSLEPLDEAIPMRTPNLHIIENRKYIPIMPPDLTPWLIHISSNYPYLEHIFMVPKVFERLKFYCTKGSQGSNS